MNKKIIKKVIKRIRWGRLFTALIVLGLFIYGVISLTCDVISLLKPKENMMEVQYLVVEPKAVEKVEKTGEKQYLQVEEEVKEEPVVEVPRSKQYRLTSYYTEDGYGTTSCTGSGKCTNDFQVNDKGWYTYNGKLVVAAATYECLNSSYGACGKWNTPVAGRKYFRYYEEIQVVIDGITYDAIVLDSCGASMYLDEDRIDLFVSNSSSAIDRGYKGVNTISVFAEYN